MYRYIDTFHDRWVKRSVNEKTPIRFVNTSMHGVSHPFVTEGFKVFGFPKNIFTPVKEQQYPDPEFPTVTFPNPEEKGGNMFTLGRV